MLMERGSRRGASTGRPSRRAVGALLFALGLLAGALLLWVGGRVYVREARIDEATLAIHNRLRLPRDAFRLEDVSADGTIRVSLRRVALLDRAGDTILSAPDARLFFRSTSFTGTGPIVFDRMDVQGPSLRLIQTPDGEWNLTQVFRVEADGNEVRFGADAAAAEDASRPLHFRDVRITDGRAMIAMQVEPGDPLPARFASRGGAPLVRIGGRTMQVRRIRDLDARLPLVRVGGTLGWRVEVADLDAVVSHPDARVTDLGGWIEQVGVERYRFAVRNLRTEHSAFAGSGEFRLTEERVLYDVRLAAAPLDFRDLRGLGFDVPTGGRATLTLAIRSLPAGRTALSSTDLVVTTPESRASGRFAAVAGGNRPWSFTDTRIALEPLDLRTVRQMGFADLPFTGEVRGTVASLDRVEQGRGGSLRIDLAASFLPRGGGGEPSSVAAVGNVAVGGEAGFRMEGVRVEARPLRLAALVPMMPERAEQLRGILRGTATVSGTARSFRIADGNLAYEVGSAPPTRVAGLTASVSLDPQLRYEVSGRAAPLALGPLTELYPALPFRTAALSGPFTVTGSAGRVGFDADLAGAAGRLAVRGSATLGEVPTFDVSGRVEALRAGAILASDVPAEGPLTGSFAARGATTDFRFDVDLTQGPGSLALGGRVQRPGDEMLFDVSGRVNRFRLGALVGRPALFASPVTGTLALSGGGRLPYRFDVDLRGQDGVFDLEGWYRPGTVASYAVRGQVSGVNMQQLPGLQGFPVSRLNATLDVEGRGTTPETFEGRVNLAATSSTVAGVLVDAATVRASATGGILRVDTLDASFRGTRMTASGTWGLTRPAPQPLRFSLSSQNLANVAALAARAEVAPPDLEGSLSAEGWVSGTFRAPTLAFALRGSGLRYGTWRAGQLTADANLARLPEGWRGRVSLVGERVALAGRENLENLRLEVHASPGLATFGVFARRDGESDVAASGALEFETGELRGAEMQSLNLRLAGATWQLLQPARIRWGGVQGIEVERLALRRSGTGAGLIEVDGRLPPTGNADLRVRLVAVDLADLRRLSGFAPEAEGILNLNAVLEGPVGEPRMTVTGSIDSLRYAGVVAERVALDARYLDRRLAGNATLRIAGRDILTMRGTLPMLISLGGTVPGFQLLRGEPLDARLVADSVPAALLAASTPAVRDAAGVLAADVTVRGTLDAPSVSGWAAVRGGAVFVEAAGQRFEGIEGRVSLQGEEIRIDSLVARSEGTARVSGTIRLDEPGRPRVALALEMNEFLPIHREDLAELQVSGNLALTGRLPQAVLSGRVVLEEGTIFIPTLDEQQAVDIVDAEVGEIGADSIPAELAGTATPAALFGGLQVSSLQVVVDEGVWLESEDARIQIQGELLINRDAGGTPRLFGDMEAVRGSYALRIGPIRREFDIERGLVQFYGTPDFNPTVDVVAVNEVRTMDVGGQSGSVLRVQVQITGTVQNPRIRLSSNTRPPLPESELLSYLAFGRSTASLGGNVGVLAQQILTQELFGGLLAAELEQELSESGLVDYVRVRSRPGEAATPFGGAGGAALGTLGLTAPTIEFGWELSEDLFLTTEVGIPTGAEQSPIFGIGLDWQINQQTRARIAREAVRPDVFTRPFYTGPAYQWSLDMRHRWEWGRAREDSATARPDTASRPATLAPAPAPSPASAPPPRGGERPAGTAAEAPRSAAPRKEEGTP